MNSRSILTNFQKKMIPKAGRYLQLILEYPIPFKFYHVLPFNELYKHLMKSWISKDSNGDGGIYSLWCKRCANAFCTKGPLGKTVKLLWGKKFRLEGDQTLISEVWELQRRRTSSKKCYLTFICQKSTRIVW